MGGKLHQLDPSQTPSNIPSITVNDRDTERDSPLHTSSAQQRPRTAPSGGNFSPLATDIEPGTFADFFGENHLNFSKRGSVLVDGENFEGALSRGDPLTVDGRRFPRPPTPRAQSSNLDVFSSPEVDEKNRLSLVIRSWYEMGGEGETTDTGLGNGDQAVQQLGTLSANGPERDRGFNPADVDRYGFVKRTPRGAKAKGEAEAKANEGGPIPRRRPSSARSALYVRSVVSTSSLNMFNSNRSKEPPWARKAPRMLQPKPELKGISRFEDFLRVRTERERGNKWLQMATRVVDDNSKSEHRVGEGQTFTFDTTNPKLIDRVWKGIPDIWRAPAWHNFLSHTTTSAQKPNFISDAELIERFKQRQEEPFVQDEEIEKDVPRTFGEHVLFKERFRSGQRSLFRVLHALGLEFPDIGFVQGMGTIVAVLLCYFEEEWAFVCAYRMWEDRGLTTLFDLESHATSLGYSTFNNEWLVRSSVKDRLESLGIGPDMYFPKWFLVLYNHTVPFEAMLRIWDVFLLLGQGEKGSKDVLYAVALALIDGQRSRLETVNDDDAVGILLSDIPITQPDVLMHTVRKEWDRHKSLTHQK